MKAASFKYSAPDTLAEAIALLADAEGDAKVLAGGQSLVPLMAFRLATQKQLVDLRRIPGLNTIAIDADGIGIGALVRWCDVESDAGLASAHPLLVEAVRHVAHYQIRNRGTIGGSLAHADPSSELPAIAITCDAQITIAGRSGSRRLRAADLIIGPLTTALEPDEIIVALHLPTWPASRRWGFEEFSRRRGDFAIAGVAVYFDEAPDGSATNAHVGVFGACSCAHRVVEAEDVLNGHRIDGDVIAAAVAALRANVEPPDDLQGNVDYRRSLAGTLFERVLTRAIER